ncbi:hypothetical protein F5141DRAFT_1068944 [Pisolithus sp. B1]|nr:hypothetical protein F5141DRAFT_1068944 [Pisolithus sp. B1]
MFCGGLFNNPWHSWHSPNQLEDIQTVRQNDLFDDDMSSAGDPADHNTSTAALTQPQTQMDTSSSSTHAQAPALAPASFIHSNLTLYAAGQHEAPESEHQVNVWSLCDTSHCITPEALESEHDIWRLNVPSHHNNLSPEQMSISHVATGKWVEPDTPLDLAEVTFGKESVRRNLGGLLLESGSQFDPRGLELPGGESKSKMNTVKTRPDSPKKSRDNVN